MTRFVVVQAIHARQSVAARPAGRRSASEATEHTTKTRNEPIAPAPSSDATAATRAASATGPRKKSPGVSTSPIARATAATTQMSQLTTLTVDGRGRSLRAAHGDPRAAPGCPDSVLRGQQVARAHAGRPRAVDIVLERVPDHQGVGGVDGEAQAMLAGDAMQALAFEVLTPDDGSAAPALQARLCCACSRAPPGHAGMAGGQAIDLASVGRRSTSAQLRDMHHRKTGALLQASVLMGAACGARRAARVAALGRLRRGASASRSRSSTTSST